MIIQNLKIFSQNVHKNSLIINTILETQNHFNIILIQEPPWSEIWKIPSTASCEGKPLMGTCHYPNWISFTRFPSDNNDFPRVITYINIRLSPLCFLLCKDISLISFLNNNVCHYILNVYSDSSHLAVKYLKDTEVNINNVLLMMGNFNIRDSLWDPSFPFHSSISDNLIMIADSFDLVLSSPTNPCPTKYSDTAGESNSIIDLTFLWFGSQELDNHFILPESCLFSDHTPLTIDISIFEEIIHMSKLTIISKSDQETGFINNVISNFKKLETSNIENIDKLEWVVNQLGSIIDKAWSNNTKKIKNF